MQFFFFLYKDTALWAQRTPSLPEGSRKIQLVEERCQGVEYKPKSEKGDLFECEKDIGVEVKGYKELPGTGTEIQGVWLVIGPKRILREERLCVCVVAGWLCGHKREPELLWRE